MPRYYSVRVDIEINPTFDNKELREELAQKAKDALERHADVRSIVHTAVVVMPR